MEVEYLKNIITILKNENQQKDEYIKLILQNNNTIDKCIFEEIDKNLDNISNIFSQLETKSPHFEVYIKLIKDSSKNHIILNKYTITYLNRENNMIDINIDQFSKKICLYLFDKLKPLYESMKITNKNKFENANIFENLLLLKNEKHYTYIIKHSLI